jgi:hypothetical protein
MLKCSDFSKHALKLDLYPQQAKILDNFFQPDKSHAVWALGRRSGKTVMAAVACVYMCFVLEDEYRRRVRKGEKWYIVTVANSQDQARIALNNIRQLYRTGQDTYTSGRGGNGGTDAAYSRVQYNDREIEYVSSLDTEPLGSTTVTATNVTTSTGVPYVNPRYFWVNTRHLFPVFHKQRFMYEREAMNGGVLAPDTEVIFYNTWWQFVCNSRRRNGIVRPLTVN